MEAAVNTVMNSQLNLAPLITPAAGHQTGNQLIGAIPLVSRIETVASSSLEIRRR